MAYTAFDRLVAWARFRTAFPHIRTGSRVCDIGCGVGSRFLNEYARSRISFGVGIDYQPLRQCEPFPAVRCDISQGIPFRSEQFDHVVMLAVLEHLERPRVILQDVFRILTPNGSLIMTWPQAVIDPALNLLHAAGLVSREMESGKHQPRIPLSQLILMMEEIGFRGFQHHRFELGLNNLLVSYKPAPAR
jgi:2-polyprenyl-3-methyl-5-hydroxy-6-metoxy-1,4-benzoquinol methylase